MADAPVPDRPPKMRRVTFLMPADDLAALDAARLALTYPPSRTSFIRACVSRGMVEVVLLADKEWPR